MEVDLFAETDRPLTAAEIETLKEKYTGFYPLFVEGILALGRAEDSTTAYYLNHFRADPAVIEIARKTEHTFPDFSTYQSDLNKAFCRFSVLFPERIIPAIYTFVSAFSYTIVVDDSILGIGLDLYLGREEGKYELLGIPAYKIRKMNSAYLVGDAMRSWVGTEFEMPAEDQDLISHMIYQGKILYALDLLLPDTPDSLKVTFTADQLSWCEKNLVDMWFHLAENELLYSKDPKQIQKYMGDAPFTPGFPEGSPGMVGRWIGWQIVRKYMDQIDEPLNLQHLFEQKDAQKILHLSKFKPT